jgi:hypothetical protein
MRVHCCQTGKSAVGSLTRTGKPAMKKKIKTPLFIALVVGVLGAGAVSARQLSLNVQTTTCQGFCDKKKHPCPNILGCGCVIQPGFTSGTCNFIAAKPASPPSGN